MEVKNYILAFNIIKINFSNLKFKYYKLSYKRLIYLKSIIEILITIYVFRNLIYFILTLLFKNNFNKVFIFFLKVFTVLN